MDNLIHEIAHAHIGVLIFALIISGVGFYYGFVGLRRARLIEDVPTAKVRSAHQGYVELIGRAHLMPGEPIIARLTQIPCCWYSYRIERHRNKSWEVVEKGTSNSLFLLRDETGDCVIDPEGAQVDSLHRKQWMGSSYESWMQSPGGYDRELNAKSGFAGMLRRNVSFGFGNYRFEESVLLEGDPLYAIGWFKSQDDSDRERSRDAMTASVLREWKQNPQELAKRFDHNKDGTVDMQEWEHARRAASAEVGKLIVEQAQDTHVHILSKPRDKAFLLSNQSQDALVKSYRWRMRLGFTGFFIGGAVATLMISAQFLTA